MASEFFNKLLEEHGVGTSPVDYTYSIVLASTREGEEKTGTVINFSFKKAVEAPSDQHVTSLMSVLFDNLDTMNLEYVDSILNKLRLSDKIPNKTKNGSGSVKMFLGDEGNNLQGDLRTGIQSTSGKFISSTTLRALLKILTIKYVTEEMKSPGAALKWQTGRFATSIDILPVNIFKNSPTKLSLYYTYMLYPYATFDPRVSTQPWLLRGNERNPQRIIGEALEKAARDIIHARYSIDIRQGR